MHPQAVPTGGSIPAGLPEYIMELIVTEDEVLQLVDKPAFHNLLCYVRPALAESDVPHRTKLTETVKAHAVQVVNVIRERLANATISGAWMTNPSNGSYAVGWMTSDNATNNDTTMKAVGQEINPEAHHFIDAVAPTPQAALMKKIQQALDNGNDADLNTLNKQLSSMDVSNNNNNNTLFDTGNSLGKALALIEQVCKEENVPGFELLQWIWTRWALLYKCLDRMLILRQEPAMAQQSFSSAKHPTTWKTIPTLECLAIQWRSMADDLQYLPIADVIEAGLKNVDKYFKKTSQSDMYSICLVLDPNYKLAYVEGRWDFEDVADGRARLGAMFDDYYTPPSQMPTTKEQSALPMRAASVCKNYGDDWMCEAIRTHKTSDHLTHNPHQELNMCLSSPLEETDDIVAWWGLHLLQYPTLAHIAQDHLPIQGSSIPSKQAFSSGGITSTI
ncbi:ribonuclease H-like domain-containing protein [Suillus americanus]|nr:ribonuclease H-like domain-containing protein [Suillus americanus]